MLADFRFALRSLRKSPGFTAVAVLTLALGIGANTAIFSVVNGVLLRPLPYPKPDDLMQVETVFPGSATGNLAYADFLDLLNQNHTFATLAVHANRTASAAAAGQGFRIAVAQVSAGFFPALGVAPVMGRVFSADDERAGRRIALASYAYWQSRLGGANFADQTVKVGDQAYAVIGVMPRGFDFPPGTELWLPRESVSESRTAQNWRVVGRLREGASRDRAQQDLRTIARQLKQEHGDGTYMTDAAVRPVLEQLVGNVRPALLVLLGAAGGSAGVLMSDGLPPPASRGPVKPRARRAARRARCLHECAARARVDAPLTGETNRLVGAPQPKRPGRADLALIQKP